jgi:hypothetical protein
MQCLLIANTVLYIYSVYEEESLDDLIVPVPHNKFLFTMLFNVKM